MNAYTVSRKHDSTIKIKQNLQQITFNSIKHFYLDTKQNISIVLICYLSVPYTRPTSLVDPKADAVMRPIELEVAILVLPIRNSTVESCCC